MTVNPHRLMTPEDLEVRGIVAAKEIAIKNYCTVQEILNGDRSKHIHKAFRELCIHLRESGLSYQSIGRLLNRDHSTIMEAVKQSKLKKRNQ